VAHDGSDVCGAIDETVVHDDAAQIVCPNCRCVIGTDLERYGVRAD
jgi:hypothetical protein